MSDIVSRRMQSEEDANDDIAAKDFQHTSAYKTLYADQQPGPEVLENNSGDAIREALLRRAKAKEMGLDNLGFSSSRIAQGGYRDEAFDSSDGENRKSILGTADARKKRDQEKKERMLSRDKKRKFNATGELGDKKDSPDTPENRQSFNSHRNSFSEPKGRQYNPYA